MIKSILALFFAAFLTVPAVAQIGAVASPPAVMSANAMAARVAAGFDLSHRGEALDLSGYSAAWDYVPSDCSRIGWETFASQPGKDIFSYNGITYTDEIGTPIYMAPPDASASGWSGINPLSCSGSGLTVTMSWDAAHSRWQSAVIETRNAYGQGYQLTYGYLEMTVTLPTPTGVWRPNGSVWAKLATQFATPSVWDEFDIFESYIASGSDPTALQTTFHRWPGTTPAVAGNVSAHTAVSTVWSGVVLDGLPHRFGMKKTPTWFIFYSDLSGSMIEIGRFPVISQQDQVPVYGQFSLFQYFDMTAVSHASTYAATLNRILMKTCTTAC